MKTLIARNCLFIILFILSSCSTELEDNFTPQEQEDLLKMTKFFKEEISGKSQDFRAGLESLIPRLTEHGYLPIVENISFKEQQELYSKLESNIFNEIWTFCKHRRYPDTVVYRSVCVNHNGKYVRFLKNLGKRNKNLKYYYQRVAKTGDYDAMNALAYMMSSHPEQFDLDDPAIQVFIAIYLSHAQ